MAKVITSDLCATCNKQPKKLKKCAGCGTVKYCDKECQAAHWPEHKALCNTEMQSYLNEIQSNITKIFGFRKFVEFIYPLAHHWSAFGTKHILCQVLKSAEDTFSLIFYLANGGLGGDDNIDLTYLYMTKDGKECQYNMFASIRREDCATEYQRCDKKVFDAILPTDFAYARVGIAEDYITIARKARADDTIRELMSTK